MPPENPETLLTIQQRRERLSRLNTLRNEVSDVPQIGITVVGKTINVNGGDIPIRTYVPIPNESLGESVDQSFPLLVWYHGGGWALGDLESEELVCRAISLRKRLSVINVAYRLSPEFQFPVGLLDCYETTKWAASNILELKADPHKGFLVGGISAGGNFAAVISLLARDDPFFKTHPLTGQILQVPAVCMSSVYPDRWKDQLVSTEELAEAPVLTKWSIKQFIEQYGSPDPHDPRVSPLLAESHKGLPPAYLQICGMDPLRDEGIVYEKVLAENGVPTKIDIYPGLPHGFAGIIPHLKASQKWKDELAAGIDWLLGQGEEKKRDIST
ncbi:hypothetical protein SISSUDRAFT_817387 [Sistotremastrum suecicum HHB10207 ss-3]|uniref:Alpha/beta hydrolase fold-3 domain-containing protein n=1 Tax=Sistotremastrum suecicum HHB10207 ss-3 TaxID=1314776 RepID=A0A166CV75_9AGAM|nr:hypothetical protein SISSUDRAFT_817387 [Sistotremastrum suecicum HHB10207 ss-3]